jgi:hypothetical protein
MNNSTPIEARAWRHSSGKTASLYGAVPWLSEADRPNWTVETTGWTVKHRDGTVGLGRKPFITREEAQAWCDANPRFSGMSCD